MRYWTLFTLRMVATIGLVFTLICWYTGRSCETEGSLHAGHSQLMVLTDTQSATVGWFPNVESVEWYRLINTMSRNKFRETGQRDERLPTQPVGALLGKPNRPWIIQVDHWVLCLTFLIATVATSVRWRKPGQKDSRNAR